MFGFNRVSYVEPQPRITQIVETPEAILNGMISVIQQERDIASREMFRLESLIEDAKAQLAARSKTFEACNEALSKLVNEPYFSRGEEPNFNAVMASGKVQLQDWLDDAGLADELEETASEISAEFNVR